MQPVVLEDRTQYVVGRAGSRAVAIEAHRADGSASTHPLAWVADRETPNAYFVIVATKPQEYPTELVVRGADGGELSRRRLVEGA